MRVGLQQLDDVEVGTMFARRGRYSCGGVFSSRFQVGVGEISAGVDGQNVVGQERSWMLFFSCQLECCSTDHHWAESRRQSWTVGPVDPNEGAMCGAGRNSFLATAEEGRKVPSDGSPLSTEADRAWRVVMWEQALELALGTLATLRELVDPAMRPEGPREPVSALPE